MKILFVGASGYGNLGDDAYKDIFSQNLSEHEIMFDSPYPDMRAVDWCDMLVVGGGGLVYVSKTAHIHYMAMYMRRALQKGKKLAFSSIGVQYYPQDVKNLIKVLDPWRKFLDRAEVITCRCPKDKEYLEQLTINKNLHYYPDLCHLVEPSDYHLTLPNADVYVVTALSLKEGKIQQHMKDSIKHGNNIYSVVMAPVDAEPTAKLMADVKTLGDHYRNRDNLSYKEAARIFKDAKRVITARYHGLIFSRAVGQDNVISVDTRHKSVNEVKPKNVKDAIGHINQLKGVL